MSARCNALSRFSLHPEYHRDVISASLRLENQMQSTFKKSVHSPLSTTAKRRQNLRITVKELSVLGPPRRPSSSINLILCVGIPAARESPDGALTKQVKCKSVSRLSGTAVCPPLAASAWMSANRVVVSRSLARSAEVLSMRLCHLRYYGGIA